MTGNLRGSLEGLGIGTLSGFALGISDSDWIRLTVATALAAYFAVLLKRNNSLNVANSFKTGFTGLAACLALLAGLYINKQQVFKKSPQTLLNLITNAGSSPEQARDMIVKQMTIKSDSDSSDLKNQKKK